MTRSHRRTVGVIGAGVSGLTAAHVLTATHDVTVFEADRRLGGHAHTHEVTASDGRELRIDSGFIVHNARTYPNLLRLFRELDVATRETEMSMSVTCAGCGLSYAEIVFPLPMAILMKTINLLPVRVWAGLASRIGTTS